MRPAWTWRRRGEAWEGHAEILEALLRFSADARRRSSSGALPAAAAAARGHGAVLRLLAAAGAGDGSGGGGGASGAPSAGAAAEEGPAPAAPAAALRLLPLPAALAEEGACFLDGALPEAFLQRLEGLWSLLPKAQRREEAEGEAARPMTRGADRRLDRSRQAAAPVRSYLCDSEGWFLSGLATALQRLREAAGAAEPEEGAGAGRAPACAEACPQMRFLHYAEPGGFLATHTDLSRTDWRTGRKSTHTFLVEGVLLRRQRGPAGGGRGGGLPVRHLSCRCWCGC